MTGEELEDAAPCTECEEVHRAEVLARLDAIERTLAPLAELAVTLNGLAGQYAGAGPLAKLGLLRQLGQLGGS